MRTLAVSRNEMRVFYFILLLFVSCKADKKISSKAFHISDSLTHKSKTLLQQNKLDSAERLIEEALKLDPSNYEAYNNRGYLKAEQNKPAVEVIQDFKKSINLNPKYDVAIFSLANYYHSIHEWDNVIEWTDKYLKLSEHKETDSVIQNIYRIRKDAKQNLSSKQ